MMQNSMDPSRQGKPTRSLANRKSKENKTTLSFIYPFGIGKRFERRMT